VLYTALSDLKDFDIMKVEQKQRNIIYKAQRENIAVEETRDMEPLWDIYISTFDRKSIEPPYSKDFFMALPELGQQRKMTDDWWGLQPYYCKANAAHVHHFGEA